MRTSVLFNACLITELCLAQTIVYSTGPDGSISAYIIASNNTASTTSSSGITTSSNSMTSYTTSATSSSRPVLPTTPYTGQSLLTGTCSIPVYTALKFEKGNIIQVPLIGCSDDRPECCPSLDSPEATAAPTSESASGNLTAAASPTPTGVISMLSQAPLHICPSDMVDIDPVCCPSGFTVWGEAILGNTPCASQLSTSYPLPSTVLNSITSQAAASVTLSSGATAATASVEIIANIVFALGLPCADEDENGEGGNEEEHKGLSTGAKAGIGAGVGVGALLAIALGVWACLKIRRRKQKEAELPPPEQGGIAQTSEYPKVAPSSAGWSPASAHDAQFAGYGQGFVDGVKAALTPQPQPMSPPQSPPPFYTQPQTRLSIIQPPVEVPGDTISHNPRHTRENAAELSGTHSTARSEVWD